MEDGDDGAFMNPDDDFQEHVRQQFQCDVCGSDHFYNDGGGTYFCSECNTQSQQARQFIDEDLTLRAGNLRRALTTSAGGADAGTGDGERARGSKRKKLAVLTSWEVFNHALKAMTEELIRIGFPTLLRAKVFQLWSAYLVRRGVLGGQGKGKKRKRSGVNNAPCLSTSETKQNMVKLFNQPQYERPRKFRKREFKGGLDMDNTASQPKHSVSVEKRLRTIQRKKALVSQLRSQAEDVDGGDGPEGTIASGSSPAALTAGKGPIVRYRFTKPAQILRRIYYKGRMKSLAPSYKRSPRVPREAQSFRKLLKPENFSFHHLFVVLFVSLRQIGCKVLLTDLLRLIDDGTLWVQSLRNILGEEEYGKIDYSSNAPLRPIYQFRKPLYLLNIIESFNRYIGLRQFHFPTFEDFLPKFIDELALPREFECLLLQIDKMYSIEVDLREIRFPNGKWLKWKYIIEIPILCRIGTILRMLFSLDDITERHQSKFANTVNRVVDGLMKKNGSRVNSWSKLFVMEDWFRFLRYRKHIVSAEIFNGKLYDPTKPPNLARLQDVMKRYGSSKETNTRPPSAEVRLSAKNYFSDIVDQAQGPMQEILSYMSVQSATDAIFQTYKDARPSVAHPEYKNEELLNMDFSKTRVDWIWNPQKYIPLVEKAGYKVKVIEGDARQYKDPILDDFLYVFQPYKCFDDFLDEKSQSFSVKFLCDALLRALGPGFEVEECVFIVNMFYFSELYCKRAYNKVIPLLH